MWYWVARGNIQQIKLHSPDRTAFALRARAAPSGECNYYVCVCVCMYVCMFACLPLALLAITLGWQQQLSRDVL